MISWLFGSRRRGESAPAAPDASPPATPIPDASASAALGLQQHQAGRLAEAEALYREALAKDPDNVDAWHFLGVLALQRGDPAQAADLISNALSRNASNAAAYNNRVQNVKFLHLRPGYDITQWSVGTAVQPLAKMVRQIP